MNVDHISSHASNTRLNDSSAEKRHNVYTADWRIEYFVDEFRAIEIKFTAVTLRFYLFKKKKTFRIYLIWLKIWSEEKAKK